MEEEKKVRLQDDLYESVNGEWLVSAVIPDDKPCCGGFADLDTEVEKILMKDFKAMANGKEEIPNHYLEEAIALYKKGLNIKRRNKEGLKPILKSLAKIKSLNSIQLFNRKLKDLVLDSYPLPFQMGIETNVRDTKQRCVLLLGPSTILPDTTYYQEAQKANHDALIGLWSQMVSQLLGYTDLSKEEQEQYLKDAIAFDAIIATLVKSQQEWSDYVKMFNPMKLSKVTRSLSPVKFKRLLGKLWEKIPEEIVVADPRWLKGFKTLFNEETYPLYQHWAYIKYILSNTAYLSEEIRSLGSSYRRALTGVAKDAIIEKQAYHVASNYFSEPVGLYYGKKYFGEEAKKDVVDIVKEIIATYKKRMSVNDFLAEDTKKKAILKLDKIVIKMGYPDKVGKLYDALSVNPRDSFCQAVQALTRANVLYEINRLYQPVDRSEWVMAGHVVNACYNPFTNDITFPAAILQAPFYSLQQSRSQNLGGIGAVIGHEISHAFDNNGAQCDENGNLHNWWTKDDLKVFKKRTKAMVSEFDGIPYMGSKVNGELVVSENIADNGGMAVTLDIMSQMKEKDYQEYFINWAKVWCLKASEQYIRLLLSIDVHSPAKLRANMTPRNFDEWYSAFDVKKSDEMFIAPNKRVHIW